MKVYLIRHGQTEGNRMGFHQGWGKVALNENGIAQAEALRDFMKDKKFDRIICSDLNRTKQTCSIVFGDRDNIQFDARLREINNSVFEGKTKEEIYKIYGDEYIRNCRRLDYSAYGGESAQSMLDRTAEFLRDLEKDTVSGKITIITHGGAILGFLSNILKMPIYTPKLKIDNCSVTKLSYSDGEWSVLYINKTVKRTEKNAD